MSHNQSFRQYGALFAIVALGACGEPLVQLVGIADDMSPGTPLNDMTGLTVDQSIPVDFRSPPDLVSFDLSSRDLSTVDLLPALDMSLDLSLLDLAVLDLRSPDLQLPDLAVLDLRLPDLAVLDLTIPADLVLPPDLVHLPDQTTFSDLAQGGNDSRCPSVLFDGMMALLSAPAIAAYNPTLDVTVEAWVYPTANGAEMIIAGHTGDPAIAVATASYYLGIDAGGHAFFLTSTTGSNANLATSSNVIPLNKWTQIAGEFDSVNTRVIVYVGGVATGVATPVVLGPKSISGVPLHIGRYSAATPITSPFKGYIDEVRFSSLARYTGTYIPSTSFSPDANTMALYHFNESMGQTAADDSTYANVGALQLNAMFANAPVCQ